MVLRTLLIPLLCLTALIAGLLIGYAVVGDQPAGDVFKWGTWQHLFDLIFADS
ncbi:DNA-directed RNA polymerase subunit beta [Paenibacillus thermoaerophilus]|uniref:DNA-directed RNA polymerase subunit beta n=1 Tax=Paenibacillus thermoaerophilus TaxID=1215385 RepID=A0ABW2V6I5_9BACL|nr:DNA-directed RNA polymerase subunit beta [Paenibacillus thermoaerophilus]TMV12532.1 DNA-directed RNA polymerase subunit beta [Paenibacillus thermoaerophilus]